MEVQAQVLGLREEADANSVRMKACEEKVAREHANLHRVLRGYEREQGHMKEKLDELWHQLPQVVAILAPLQVQLLQVGPPESVPAAVKADTAVQALKPLSGLIESAIQKFVNEVRRDVLGNLSTIQGELGTKASSDELTLLRDRVE